MACDSLSGCSPARALHIGGQALLVRELVEMGAQRDGGDGTQLGGHVRAMRRRAARRSSGGPRRAPRAAGARAARRCSMYCVELRARLPDRRARDPGRGPRGRARAACAGRRDRPASAPAVGSDEHAAFAEHRVAREARPVADQREVIGGMPGVETAIEGPEAGPFGELHVDLAPSARPAARGAARVSGESLGVIGVVVGQRDAAEPAARVDAPRAGARGAPSSAGPGSTT